MNKLVTFLAVAAVGFATLCAVSWQKRAAHEAQIAALREEVEQKKTRIEELQAAQQQAEQGMLELRQRVDELSSPLREEPRPGQLTQTKETATQPQATNTPSAAAEGGGLGTMLSKMMSDPDTKKFIRDQQRMMVEQLYRPLIKRLGLTSDEAAAFKDLLADNLMKGAEKATSFLATPAGGMALT